MKSRAWALACAVVLFAGHEAFAASSPAPSVWRDVDEASLGADGSERVIVPTRYRTLELDRDALLQTLAAAPLEFTADAAAEALSVVLSLPMPDATSVLFRVEESPIMEPGLAQQHPEIKTYRGQGLDDPTASARFGWTSAGFHAIVLAERGTVYIDPYRRGDTTSYISYFKRDHRPTGEPFRCLLDEMEESALAAAEGPLALTPSGDTLRTYRLALAANVEYSDFHSPADPPLKADVLNNGIIPTMNRINGVYERDVAVRMVLVADEMNVIFVVEPDGYENASASQMINVNQTIIDGIIGFANYDIGHVFSTGGGGVAGLRVPCGANKARGVTGLGTPTGDPFDIDYVAHEMGHQFGGNHSFNGNAGSCAGGNRNASTAYEVGSGSTIMSYAGICGAQNLQPHSDDYFHNINFVEIQAFTTNPGTGDSCAARTATGNQAPAVEAGPSFTIPSRTPFALTASGSDPNGDQLTFCWEEFDLGPAGAGTFDDGLAPILRSFLGTSNPTRTFPKISDILGNVTTYGEVLPTTNRTMTFRVTARDNRAGGGGVEWDSTQVTVRSAAGPFRVTAPNTAVTWYAGVAHTVTWDVAGTASAPIGTANVAILLSTDGGLTFPTVLAASTANDGSQAVTIPALATTTARVKVQAVANVFFDISDLNFTISTSPPPTASPVALAVDAGGNQVFQVVESASMAPTWRNTGTVFISGGTGTLSSFTGPLPATYTILDGAASYGSMAVGASASCTTNCYSLRITASTRPAQHWDASVLETTTLAPGASKTWTLHVGDSFGDVPSSLLFYREVETLLHTGVTSGCGAGSYCPASPVLRAQMAVFLLRAKLGSGYVPPPWTGTFFTDVPNDFFGPYIEDLARRGIAGGCTETQFCPNNAALRSQMAVFLLRSLLGSGYTPPAWSGMFTDVPDDFFGPYIEDLVRRGIASGCSGTAFCPNDPVTRSQMAAFLTRTFGLSLYGP